MPVQPRCRSCCWCWYRALLLQSTLFLALLLLLLLLLQHILRCLCRHSTTPPYHIHTVAAPHNSSSSSSSSSNLMSPLSLIFPPIKPIRTPLRHPRGHTQRVVGVSYLPPNTNWGSIWGCLLNLVECSAIASTDPGKVGSIIIHTRFPSYVFPSSSSRPTSTNQIRGN